MPSILAFGASIVYGAWDSEGGWVQRLRTFLDEEYISGKSDDFFVYNLGNPIGVTSEMLLSWIEVEARNRVSKDAITIISIGANDSAFDSEKGDFWVSAERYKENLKQIFEKANNFSKNVIFLGLIPCDEEKTNPISWDTKLSHKT